jgi:hypothetical protein
MLLIGHDDNLFIRAFQEHFIDSYLVLYADKGQARFYTHERDEPWMRVSSCFATYSSKSLGTTTVACRRNHAVYSVYYGLQFDRFIKLP